jgi:hypothetical protein
MATPEIMVHAPAKDEKKPDLTTIPERPSTPYPLHPIAQLQGPFEESIVETTDHSGKDWVVDIDAQTRRRDLLENDQYERLCGRRWRQRESEK